MSIELAHTTAHGTSGEVIVFLGSIGSRRSVWEPQLTGFAAADPAPTTIAVDLRGHGDSPAPPGPYTIDDLAGDVLALLDRAGVASAHLVGLSLGGAVAQWLAAHHPARVRTLTLLCTSAHFAPLVDWPGRARTVRESGVAGIADGSVQRWLTPEFRAAHPDLTARCRDMIADTDDEGYAGCCDALATWDGRPDLARIAAPTLAIAGAQDPVTPPAELAVPADGIPDARLVELSPGAHVVALERPDEVTALIAAHVTQSRAGVDHVE